mmetsp:Transcript_46251/g.145568  ORF Transcript_46251/g.145568 Transcript_46251/m.145568 type:complete len:210 (-) Transcript_46251:32-661(-)
MPSSSAVPGASGGSSSSTAAAAAAPLVAAAPPEGPFPDGAPRSLSVLASAAVITTISSSSSPPPPPPPQPSASSSACTSARIASSCASSAFSERSFDCCCASVSTPRATSARIALTARSFFSKARSFFSASVKRGSISSTGSGSASGRFLAAACFSGCGARSPVAPRLAVRRGTSALAMRLPFFLPLSARAIARLAWRISRRAAPARTI